MGSLEDLALVEGAARAVGAAPREVLLHESFGLVAGGVQLLPLVRLVVDLQHVQINNGLRSPRGLPAYTNK